MKSPMGMGFTPQELASTPEAVQASRNASAAARARGYLDQRKRKDYSPAPTARASALSAMGSPAPSPRTDALSAIGTPASPYSPASQPGSPIVPQQSVQYSPGPTSPGRVARENAQIAAMRSNPLNDVNYKTPEQIAFEDEAKGRSAALSAAAQASSSQMQAIKDRLGSNAYQQEGSAMAADDLAKSAARSAGGYAADGGVMRRGTYTPMPAMADAGGANLTSGQQQRTTAMLDAYEQQQDAAQAARNAAYDKVQMDRLTGNAPGLTGVDPNIIRMADSYGLQGAQRDAYIKTQMERMNAGRYRYGISEQDMKRAQPISPMELLDRRMDATDEETAAAKQAMMAGRVASGRTLPAGFVADMSPGSPASREMAVRQERMNRAGQRRAAEEARAAAMAQNAQMQVLINASLAGNPNASRILDTMAAQGDRNAQLAMEAAAMQQRAATDSRRLGLQEQEMRLLDERQRSQIENDKIRNQAYAELSAAEAAKMRADSPLKPGDPTPLPNPNDIFWGQVGEGVPVDQARANVQSQVAVDSLMKMDESGNRTASAVLAMPPTSEMPDASGVRRASDFFKRYYDSSNNGSPVEPEELDPSAIMLGLQKEGINKQDALAYYKELEKARGETLRPRRHPASPSTVETDGLGYAAAGTSMKNTLRIDREMQVLAGLFGFGYKPMRPTTAEDVREMQNYRNEIDARSWMPQTF